MAVAMFDRTLSRRTVLGHAATAVAGAGTLGVASRSPDGDDDAPGTGDDCAPTHVDPAIDVVGADQPEDDERGVDYVARAGDAITFDAGETETTAPVAGFEWTLGEASIDGERVHHAFERGDRVATVTLSVTDEAGRSATANVRIAVRSHERHNRAPTPIHDVSPTRTYDDGYVATVGERLTFDGRESTDPDGDVVGYEWAFRRGAKTGAVVEHAFRRAGNYRVTLTVTDDDGERAAVEIPIHVTR